MTLDDTMMVNACHHTSVQTQVTSRGRPEKIQPRVPLSYMPRGWGLPDGPVAANAEREPQHNVWTGW